MQSLTTSTSPAIRVRPDLQSVIPQATRLVSVLRMWPVEAISLDVKDTVAVLAAQLDDVAARQYAGDTGTDNGTLCAVGCDSAFLVAAMLSTGEAFDLDTLPREAREAFGSLQAQLFRLGLMDVFDQGNGTYSI